MKQFEDRIDIDEGFRIYEKSKEVDVVAERGWVVVLTNIQYCPYCGKKIEWTE